MIYLSVIVGADVSIADCGTGGCSPVQSYQILVGYAVVTLHVEKERDIQHLRRKFYTNYGKSEKDVLLRSMIITVWTAMSTRI